MYVISQGCSFWKEVLTFPLAFTKIVKISIKVCVVLWQQEHTEVAHFIASLVIFESLPAVRICWAGCPSEFLLHLSRPFIVKGNDFHWGITVLSRFRQSSAATKQEWVWFRYTVYKTDLLYGEIPLSLGLWSRNSNIGFQLQASNIFGSGSRTIWSIKN